jgi:hypothetical protein
MIFGWGILTVDLAATDDGEFAVHAQLLERTKP